MDKDKKTTYGTKNTSKEEKKKSKIKRLSEDESEVVEFEFNDDGEEDFKKTLKKLRNNLKTCKAEKEEYLNGWQKERADFANYRKEEDARRNNYSKTIREQILTRFLTVLDSFNMAFSNKEAWKKVDKNWCQGIEYIYTQLNSIFTEYDVKEIGQIGEDFDPNLHQSVEITKTNKKENNNKISLVIQKGYKFSDRVIRAARVNVFEYNEKTGK